MSELTEAIKNLEDLVESTRQISELNTETLVDVEDTLADVKNTQSDQATSIVDLASVQVALADVVAGFTTEVDALEARVATLEQGTPVEPPIEPPVVCGPIPEITYVPDSQAGIREGLIYDFDFEDGRVPTRQQPDKSGKLSRELVYPGSCNSLLMDRLADEIGDTSKKSVSNARSEFIFFGDSDRLDTSRMQWGKSYWFRWRFAVGQDWTFPEVGYQIVAQIHDSSSGNGGPPFNISAAVPTHRRDTVTPGHWVIEGHAFDTVQPGPVVAGEFVEVIMHVVPDQRNGNQGGLFEIWWNGDKVVDVKNVQTFRAVNRENHLTAPGKAIIYGPYPKFGIYESYTNPGGIKVFFDRMTVWGGNVGLDTVVEAWDYPAS